MRNFLLYVQCDYKCDTHISVVKSRSATSEILWFPFSIVCGNERDELVTKGLMANWNFVNELATELLDH
jgi:hypothetical protein